MKRLFAAILALPALVMAATTTPVQLLSPAGSTAGQAIVSSGPSSAPAWGAVSATALAPVAANTVIANPTGSSAAPTAHAVPSCSTANSALKWTSGTGLSCGTTFALTSGNLSQFASTTSAQLLGVLSDETGSGAAVFGTSPTIGTATINTPTISGGTINNASVGATTASTGRFTSVTVTTGGVGITGGLSMSTGAITPVSTAGITGTTTNDNVTAGGVGEYTSSSTTATSMTNNVAANCHSVSLSAGDWDVAGVVKFNPAGTTTFTAAVSGTNTVSATQGALGTYQQLITSFTTGGTQSIMAPMTRYSLSGTTTVFLIGVAQFGVSTMTCDGFIRVRRVR